MREGGEGGAAGSGGCVSPSVCVCAPVCVRLRKCECAGVPPSVCVCVQSSDCQCCTTVQVEQCRMTRDTEGQRGGGREVVREVGRGEEV